MHYAGRVPTKVYKSRLHSMRDLMAYTSLRLRGGSLGHDDDLDPAEVIATIFRMRTGAA